VRIDARRCLTGPRVLDVPMYVAHSGRAEKTHCLHAYTTSPQANLCASCSPFLSQDKTDGCDFASGERCAETIKAMDDRF
jgi:hypothetical protein